jgi:SAM-dependent methyltransferase
MASNAAVYTHGHHESVLRSHRWRTAVNSAAYLVPHLEPGMSLLDVGSGPGTITVDLARLVAPGVVTACEVTAEALALARAEAERQQQDNLAFEVADVNHLPFDDDTFDIVHAHQVLQHLNDPVRALAEMRRVCKPGGHVAARDGDYEAFTWFPAVPELDEWLALYRKQARANGGEPDAGRRLVSWAKAAGFAQVTAGASVWCFAAPEDRAWWGESWAERIVSSSLAKQAVAAGEATTEDLRRISGGWLTWAAADDGWFATLHGEILCQA